MGAIYIFIEQRVGPLRMTHINTSAVQHKMFAVVAKNKHCKCSGFHSVTKWKVLRPGNYANLTFHGFGFWAGYLSFITVGSPIDLMQPEV